MGQQVVESRPRETAALTSAIEPLQKYSFPRQALA